MTIRKSSICAVVALCGAALIAPHGHAQPVGSSGGTAGGPAKPAEPAKADKPKADAPKEAGGGGRPPVGPPGGTPGKGKDGVVSQKSKGEEQKAAKKAVSKDERSEEKSEKKK